MNDVPSLWEQMKPKYSAFFYTRSDPNTLVSRDETGRTLLMVAIREHNLRMVRFLVSRGIPLNATDQRGNTALHVLATSSFNVREWTSLAKLILRNGGDRRVQNLEGQLAVDLMEPGRVRILKEFPTTLFECLYGMELRLLRLYLEDGYLPTTRDNTGKTLLQLVEDRLTDTDLKKPDLRPFLAILVEYGYIH